MKITIENQESNKITYLIEREKGTYNNIVETVNFTNEEIQNLNENEIKTLGYLKVKHIAMSVFEQIEPLAEEENPVGFSLVPSRPTRIEVFGSNSLMVGQKFEYNAIVHDQYNMPMITDIRWTNKVITAAEVGEIVVNASIGDISATLVVNVIERIKTKEELLQEALDNIASYNVDMDYRLSILELGV